MLLNETILHNAKHDSLTGDYNRAKFISDYEEKRFNGMLIAFTDVNKFKILIIIVMMILIIIAIIIAIVMIVIVVITRGL